MRKKEVNGSSCIIPTFHISILPFKYIFSSFIQADSDSTLAAQILILEEQKKEVSQRQKNVGISFRTLWVSTLSSLFLSFFSLMRNGPESTGP